MQSSGFIEPPHYIQNDADLDFVAVSSKGEKGNFRNPIGGLIRYQFLEILVRSGVRKYFDNAKTAETRVDAVRKHLK